MIKRILNVAIPYIFENAMFFVGRIVFIAYWCVCNGCDLDKCCCWDDSYVSGFTRLAIGVGFSVIIARCVGAGDFDQVKFYTRKIMILVYLLQIFTVGAFLILLGPILNLYNLSSQASAMTSQVVWCTVLLCWFLVLAYTFAIVFRASSDAKFCMWVSILYVCVSHRTCLYLCLVVWSCYLGLSLPYLLIGLSKARYLRGVILTASRWNLT